MNLSYYIVPQMIQDSLEYPGEGNDEFLGERFIPYEPEEPEEALKFIFSIISLLIERVIPEKPRVLTLEKAGKCLRILGKIWNLSEYPPVNMAGDASHEKLMDMEGYVDEYQYLHIEAVDLSLTDVRILPQHFVWLLSADLSGNRLTNETACPLTKLPNLVALRLNRNRFEDPYMPPMKHLQYLGLNHNQIKSLHRIYHPNLETLDLNYNLVKKVDAEDCWKLDKLTQLELRGNSLTTTSGIEYGTLVNLYLAENQITELKGIETLVNLKRLHLRENPIANLDDLTDVTSNLEYLNLRKCQLETVYHLKPLSNFTSLKELIIMGNPFLPEPEKPIAEERDRDDLDEEEEGAEDKDIQEEALEREEFQDDDQTRLQILSFFPDLVRINKRPVTKEERQSVQDVSEE